MKSNVNVIDAAAKIRRRNWQKQWNSESVTLKLQVNDVDDLSENW